LRLTGSGITERSGNKNDTYDQPVGHKQITVEYIIDLDFIQG
jgi:hypothetical protein